MKKLKHYEKLILVFTILLIPFLYLSSEISMMWSETTCAEILYLDKTKGSTYVYYKFNVNNKTIRANKSILYFRFRKLEELKKKPCFWIKYSTIFPKNTRIIDKDLKAP